MTEVTAAGLQELAKLPRLRYLYVPMTVTKEELTELRKLMPDVRISQQM
jgi:hypothetical protein